MPFLLTIRRHDIHYLAGSRIYIFSILYLVFLYLTIFWGESTEVSDYSKYGFRLLYLFCFLSVVASQFYDIEYELRFYRLLCWVAAVAAVISMILFYRDHPFPELRLSNWGNLDVIILGASCYGSVAIICFYKFLVSQKLTALYMVIFLILVADVLLTQSRGPLLALVAAVFAGELLRRNYKWVLPLVSLVILYGILIVSDLLEPVSILTRYGWDSDRFEIWQGVLVRVAEAPWFGYGLSVDETVIGESGRHFDHPHSVYVSSLLYGGTTSFVLLTVVIGLSLYQGYKQYVLWGDPLCFVLLLYGLICVMTDNDKLLTHPAPIWLFFWFPIALLASKELKRSRRAIRNGV